MRINLTLKAKKLKRWYWLWYPAVVVVVVVGSSTGVLFGGVGLWQRITSRSQDVSRQAEIIANYKKKMAVLEKLDGGKLEKDLLYLSDVVPYSSRVWEVISLARSSGDEVGMRLVEWKAYGGEVVGDVLASSSPIANISSTGQTMTGLYDTSEIAELMNLLLSLERRLPLIGVKRVVYQSGKTQVDLEGIWSSYVRVASEINSELPVDTQSLVDKIRRALAEYKKLEVGTLGVGRFGRENPF